MDMCLFSSGIAGIAQSVGRASPLTSVVSRRSFFGAVADGASASPRRATRGERSGRPSVRYAHTVTSASAEKKTPVGFIGLGHMGALMAMRLQKHGFDVHVWNRDQAKAAALVEAGAKLAKSPAEVVEGSAYTFTMLADPEACNAVFFGKDGVLEALAGGKGHIECSSIDPESSIKMAEAAAAKGGRYLEAPVSGSKGPAADGALVFMTAGDESLHKEATPALDVMGKKAFYLGEAGKAMQMKLLVNMVMGTMMAGFAEGMALGAAMGLDQQTVLDILDLGAMSNPMFRVKGPNVIAGSYAPAFPLKHQNKDLKLALKLGYEYQQPLPVASSASKQYEGAVSDGLGEQDFSAVYEQLKIEAAEEGEVGKMWFGN
eukprot:tig00020941_g16227.t1